ncbi:MAG: L,D-transpeptidase family protein [Alphaproteobacteria bacterium]|jgi:L,D-peptidoglycan transpeptidase YkuD (ErfK/YbiS/YcfS/YnhG family)|nr:L,D-transpeptidase family protein [Alphaproteobacteria bacterium]MBT7943562.1 L,D-transpeptidase family protein [Alphaproteobacteria bacterium]
MEITVQSSGHLTWNARQVRCALGRGGISSDKVEGDGVTPAGNFPLRRVHYRADRMSAPQTKLTTRAIEADDGWCDEPADPAYNKLIKRPLAASHEELWRADHVYDVIVELGHNDEPPVPGLGSAIFMHVVRPGFEPTEGCVALKMEDLLDLLADCDEATVIAIAAE